MLLLRVTARGQLRHVVTQGAMPRGVASRGIIQQPPRSTSTSSSSSSTPLRQLSSNNFGRHTIRGQASRQGQQQQQQRRNYSSGPPGGGVKFWPFVVIIGLGSFGYYSLAKSRHEAAQAHQASKPRHSSPNFPIAPQSRREAGTETAAADMAPTTKTGATFSAADVTVLFVLGGPGSGKGTQSAKLVKSNGFVHLSAGDLLRAEQNRPGSRFGDLISTCIRDGTIVPMEVTVKLLEKAMRESLLETPEGTERKKAADGNHDDDPEKTDLSGLKAKFLIDGFPRKMDQALRFEETVCRARFVLFYDCPEEEMEKRLLERGKTSGRADDNPESIRKRFRTFVEDSMPVVDRYEKEGRVVRVLATRSVDEVEAETRRLIRERGIGEGLE